MRESAIFAIPTVVLGGLLALVPFYLLPVCGIRHDAPPMRCHWSGVTLATVGGALVLVAAMQFFFRARRARTALSAVATCLSIAAMLVPTWLVGMCGAATMPCRTGTLPAAIILLALAASANLAAFLFLKRPWRTGAAQT